LKNCYNTRKSSSTRHSRHTFWSFLKLYWAICGRVMAEKLFRHYRLFDLNLWPWIFDLPMSKM